MRVVVAGAGALGLSIAVSLARTGAAVTVTDPAAFGANASGVAAGMLAPAFESVFDDRPEHFDLLLKARDLWPAFAGRAGIEIERPDTLAVSHDEARIEDWRQALDGLGIVAAVRSRQDMERLRPDLAAGLFGLSIEEDWRLDPRGALAALRGEAGRLGVAFRATAVADFTPGRVVFADGAIAAAEALVIATGASPGLVELAPELAGLTPIKGHILEFAAPANSTEIVRFDGGYICPTRAGVLLGATMEAGRNDTDIDPDEAAKLHDRGAHYAPALRDATPVTSVGVRAATTDGLPLVGRGVTPGVWIAVGARRNGWLLAPLVARTLVEDMIEARSSSCLAMPEEETELRASRLGGKSDG